MQKCITKKITAASLCLLLTLAAVGCGGSKEAETTAAPTTEASAPETEAAENDTEATIDFSAGAPDDIVNQVFYSDSIGSIEIKGHNVEPIEGDDVYIAHDIVSIEYSAGNPTGLFPQTVGKDVDFYLNKDTNAWDMLNETYTLCNVDTSELSGKTFMSDSLTPENLQQLFGDEISSDDNGALYLKFNQRLGLLAFNLKNENNTSIERYFTTNLGGKLIWVGKDGNIEKSFKITDGSITDEGDIYFAVGTDVDILYINFASDVTSISEMEYNEAIGAEVEEGYVYLEDLPTFEVTSSSLDENQWQQQIGQRYDNVSPELSWDAVDGASCYAVIMLDKIAHNWLHWSVLVDKTHLEEGEFSGKEAGYVGPYPEETHEYTVYVVALRSEPSISTFRVDSTGSDINTRLIKINEGIDGTKDNIISYGVIKGDFVP